MEEKKWIRGRIEKQTRSAKWHTQTALEKISVPRCPTRYKWPAHVKTVRYHLGTYKIDDHWQTLNWSSKSANPVPERSSTSQWSSGKDQSSLFSFYQVVESWSSSSQKANRQKLVNLQVCANMKLRGATLVKSLATRVHRCLQITEQDTWWPLEGRQRLRDIAKLSYPEYALLCLTSVNKRTIRVKVNSPWMAVS